MGGHFGVLFSGNGNYKLGQYRIILSADTASEVRQLPERCLSRKAGIVRYCLYSLAAIFTISVGNGLDHSGSKIVSVIFFPIQNHHARNWSLGPAAGVVYSS